MKHKIFSKKRIRRFLRYLILFLVIFITTQQITKTCVDQESAIIISSVGAITFSILDMYFPQIY